MAKALVVGTHPHVPPLSQKRPLPTVRAALPALRDTTGWRELRRRVQYLRQPSALSQYTMQKHALPTMDCSCASDTG
jgi:hypothetical protein